VCSTDELEDDVNASDLGDLIECDGLVGAALAKSFVVLARSRDGNHVRANACAIWTAAMPTPPVEPDIKTRSPASR